MEEKRELTVDEKLDILIEVIEHDRSRRRSSTRLCVICATIAFIALLCIGGLFAALASGLTISTESTETTVTQDTGTGTGNNVYQSGESAQYHESEE